MTVKQEGPLPTPRPSNKGANLTEKNDNSNLKHYMYAGQWFLFTMIGIFFLIILNRKSNGKN